MRDLAEYAPNNWHPEGCGTLKSVISHEIGHNIDYILNAREDKEIKGLFGSLKKQDVINGLSEYGSESVSEFIAESWAEYRNNSKPRKISQEVSKKLIDMWRLKFRS